MALTIDKIKHKYGISMCDIDNSILVDIFNSTNLDINKYDLENGKILNIIGLYYQYIKKNYELTKKYYLLAIEKENVDATYNLGRYYECFENHELMKVYYLLAIEKNHVGAMNKLGLYYQKIQNYELMKKYYLMAIEQENVYAMNILGCYYGKIEKNYDLLKKYLLLAVEKEYVIAMNNLGHYYKYTEKNYELMKKYYLLAIEKEDMFAMFELGEYYGSIEKNYELMKKYYVLSIEKNYIDAIICLQHHYKNNIVELYILFNSIENKNEPIIEALVELKEYRQVEKYLNLLELNEEHECLICYDTNKMVITQCNHNTICKNCYIKIDRCPFCRVEY